MTVYSRWEVNNQSNKDVMPWIIPQISRYLVKSSAIFMIENLQKITAAGQKYRIDQHIWVSEYEYSPYKARDIINFSKKRC